MLCCLNSGTFFQPRPQGAFQRPGDEVDVLFSETKISKLIIDRDQCVSLEVSEGVIPRTHAIQKASHMNIVLRSVCSDSLVTKREEKNS